MSVVLACDLGGLGSVGFRPHIISRLGRVAQVRLGDGWLLGAPAGKFVPFRVSERPGAGSVRVDHAVQQVFGIPFQAFGVFVYPFDVEQTSVQHAQG